MMILMSGVHVLLLAHMLRHPGTAEEDSLKLPNAGTGHICKGLLMRQRQLRIYAA